MKTIVLLQVLLIGCSSGSDSSRPHAALRVTVGSAAPSPLATDITSSATSSRFMMQTSDDHLTVFVSLPTPVRAQQMNVSGSDAQSASIWAKQDALLPLIATSGTVTIENSENLFNFEFVDVSKPADASGTSLLITGSMNGVSVPP